MHSNTLRLISLALALFTCSQAAAWSHATRWGGSASGGDGSWSATNRYGGTASGSDGSWNASGERGSASGSDGSWSASNHYGGTASGSDGAWSATSANGSTAYGYRGPGYATTSVYHPTYYGTSYYHPPTTVNYYSSGCYDCSSGISPAGAAVAGAAVGVAAANAANSNAYYSTYSTPPNAYAAGYSAGQAAASTGSMPIGAMYTSLPAGCSMQSSAAGTYYICGQNWLKPNYGAGGIFYTVIPPP